MGRRVRDLANEASADEVRRLSTAMLDCLPEETEGAVVMSAFTLAVVEACLLLGVPLADFRAMLQDVEDRRVLYRTEG